MALTRCTGGRLAKPPRAGRGCEGTPDPCRPDRTRLGRPAARGAAIRVPSRQVACIRRAGDGGTSARPDGGGIRGERTATGTADARFVGARPRHGGPKHGTAPETRKRPAAPSFGVGPACRLAGQLYVWVAGGVGGGGGGGGGR